MDTTPLETIISVFGGLDDPRQPGKVKYSLQEILLLVLCSTICGANSIVEIVEFGEDRIDYLRKLLPYENGIPSHDTIGKLLAAIDNKQFSEAFISWTNNILKIMPEFISIDGKTLRRTMNGDIPPAHIISVWASKQNMILGQLKTDNKSNEITAIPELLDLLILNGSIITIDAMGCQTKIAEKIINKGANYVLTVKGNQKKLHDDIKKASSLVDLETSPFYFDSITTLDKNHGRLETRKYDICYDVELLEERYNWPNIVAFARVTSTRETSKGIEQSIRYFISSKALSVELFAQAVRGHWSIENRLHWVLDVVFREDESRARAKNLAANLATLRHISFNMLKKLDMKQSIRVRRKLASWSFEFMLKVLTSLAAD